MTCARTAFLCILFVASSSAELPSGTVERTPEASFSLLQIGTVSSGGKCLQAHLLFGTDSLKADYEDVCCTVPQEMAEPSGSMDAVKLWDQLDSTKPTTFYDSQCGIPLFIAPKGRTFEEWKAESKGHGWPSFRKEELVTENVITKEGGEMVSKCGTHLGHDLPDGSGARYCIDLLCISGNQKATTTLLTKSAHSHK